MRSSPLIPIALLTVFILVIDLYAFRGVRGLTANLESRWRLIINVIYWLIPLLMFVGVVWSFVAANKLRAAGNFTNIYYVLGFFVLCYVPKLSFIAFTLVSDAVKLVAWLFAMPFGSNSAIAETSHKISRSTFLSQVGLVVAAVPFFSIAWGIAKGRFNFRVRRQVLQFDNLPEAFDGFTIAQISDMHIGSFEGYTRQVEAGIALINEQNPDIVIFTGDLVNNTADEIDGWEHIIGRIEARYGKFSVLGNHDYGEYYPWPNEEAKQANLDKMVKKHHEMGFTLLRNSHATVQKDGQQIGIVGVENWGKRPFPQYGDYDKAAAGIEAMPFKILLSHDPTHWEEKIMNQRDAQITFSGHTHGMQFGIDIPGLRWSPVKLRYPRWGGLYTENGQHLYVNIGFGFIAFPGRVGTAPEITLVELRRKTVSS